MVTQGIVVLHDADDAVRRVHLQLVVRDRRAG